MPFVHRCVRSESRAVALRPEAWKTRLGLAMLRIHGDGILLRSLLSREQAIDNDSQKDAPNHSTAIENDLHYRQKTVSIAINSQSH